LECEKIKIKILSDFAHKQLASYIELTSTGIELGPARKFATRPVGNFIINICCDGVFNLKCQSGAKV